MGIFQRMTDTLRGRVSSVSRESLRNAEVAQNGKLNFEDHLTIKELAFEWADSYDCKDPSRLREILAPAIHVDYTEVNGNEYIGMPAEQFVSFMFHTGFLGDQLVHTQHLLGASKFTVISAIEVEAVHQIRAAHQRYTGADKQTVENKGHGHAMIQHKFVKINGEWKLAGLRPSVRWNEFAFDKIFLSFDPAAIMAPSVQNMARVTGSAGLVTEKFAAPGQIEVA